MVFMPHSNAAVFIGFGFLGTIRKYLRTTGIRIRKETKDNETKRNSAM
jgi:hypothetical protein